MIALSGVRSSCDMLARKRDLYALARRELGGALLERGARDRELARLRARALEGSGAGLRTVGRAVERDRDGPARRDQQLGVDVAPRPHRGELEHADDAGATLQRHQHRRARHDVDEPRAQRQLRARARRAGLEHDDRRPRGGLTDEAIAGRDRRRHGAVGDGVAAEQRVRSAGAAVVERADRRLDVAREVPDGAVGDVAELELAAELVVEAGQPGAHPLASRARSRSSARATGPCHHVRAMRDLGELVAAGRRDRRREVVAAEPLEPGDDRAEVGEERQADPQRDREHRDQARRADDDAHDRRVVLLDADARRRNAASSSCSSNAVAWSIIDSTRARLLVMSWTCADTASPPPPAISLRVVATAVS